MSDKEDFRLLLSMRRKLATTRISVQNYDKVAEDNKWRYCERCETYEEHDDDKCKRCGAPLYKYSTRGEGNAR